jgi:catalase
LAGGDPIQLGPNGFASFPEPITADKVRGKPEKFADHFSQATLFWNSQTPVEKAHIVRGFRFELTKVEVPAIRQRTVAMLRNVSEELAQAVSDGLGMPVPPRMRPISEAPPVEIDSSAALSLTARPGDGSIAGRKIAVLLARGFAESSVKDVRSKFVGTGAVLRFLGVDLAPVDPAKGVPLDPDATLETKPSVLFDAVVVPDGADAAKALSQLGQALEFLKDQYRHCKPILLLGAGSEVASAAGIPLEDKSDWAMTRDVPSFIEAIGRHRNWDRATDPPVI